MRARYLSEFDPCVGERLDLPLVGLGLLGGRLRVPDGLHARVVRPHLVLLRLVHVVPLEGTRRRRVTTIGKF